MGKIERRIVFGIIICLILINCRAVPETVRIKMDYTPTNIVPPPRELPDITIFLNPLEDRRETPDQVGENTEKPKIVPVKTGQDEVTSFIEKSFRREFGRAGLNIVDSKEKANRIFQISLHNLWVKERNTYQASVMVNVNVQDQSGKNLVSQGFSGLNTRWGKSYNENEYRKALSDAVVDLLKNMFNDSAFMKSLK